MNTEFNEYLYVLDYSDCSINKIILTERDRNLETEDILSKYNFDIDCTSYMITTKDINEINIING